MSDAPRAVPLTMVVAIGGNGAIGHENGLPWHAPSDLKRFRALTLGKPLIMGRKTYESIGRPLPGRITIVVTRNPDWRPDPKASPETLRTAADLDSACEMAQGLAQHMDAKEIIIAGGAALYRAAWKRATFLRVTHLDCSPEADAFFPAITPHEWRETARSEAISTPQDDCMMTFIDYERIDHVRT